MESAPTSLSAMAMRAVMRQVQEMMSQPIDGITLRESDDLSVVEADIQGPEDTPFFGGTFTVALVLSADYPEQPPKGFFRTRIFHPNVSEKGEVCVNTLKKDWSPSLGLRHVFTVIRCLLIEPNPESALNEEAGRLLLEEYGEYVKKARMMTNVHAHRGGGVAQKESTDSASSHQQSQGLQVRTATDSNTPASIAGSSTSAINASTSTTVEKKSATVSAADKRKAALRKL